MLDQALHEFKNGNSFFDIFLIFMSIVMKRDKITVVFIDAGSGNGRTSEITPNIFGNSFGIAFLRFSKNIEAMGMILIAGSFDFFEGRSDSGFHFIKKSSTESISQESVVEVGVLSPLIILAETTFRNEAMNMRIPFQVPTKGVKDHDKAGSERKSFVFFLEQTENDTGHGMKEAFQQRTIIQEERSKIFIDRENTVTMGGIEKLERHGIGAFHGILVAASRAETTMTAKRNKFELIAAGANVHSTTERRIAAMSHSVDVFNDGRTRM